MIQKRGNTWAVTVYDPATKAKRWVGTFPDEKTAKRRELEAKLEQPEVSGTVQQYADRWLTLHPRGRESTMIQYRERISVFCRAFGQRQLASINRLEAREWCLDNRSAHGPVRAMYSDAIRDGLVGENPFGNLRLQQSRGRKDLDVMTVDEVRAAIRIAGDKFGPSFAAFIATAGFCGMRPGELYALTWPRLDFEENEIVVASSYSSKSGATTRPKNGKERRIVLFPEAKKALEQLPVEAESVFLTVTGKQLTGKTLSFYWDPIRTAIGRPQESFYALRHFCASYLLNDLGHEAEDVAYQLGHTDGGVLIRTTYGHPSESLARERLKGQFGRKIVPLRGITGANAGANSA